MLRLSVWEEVRGKAVLCVSRERWKLEMLMATADWFDDVMSVM